jgi:hypothetical protein
MKPAKTLVSAILIPALLVASGESTSESVQKLLRKPRYAPAEIDFVDGTHVRGVVSRVTSQFVTLRDAEGCLNVELAQIASVKWLPNQDESWGDKMTLIAMVAIASPVLIPLVIAEALGHRDKSRNPLYGNWESNQTTPEAKISRIEGSYQTGFIERSLAVERGRYEIIGQDLHLAYDESGLVETIPFQFDCDSLILGDQKLLPRRSPSPAQTPIVDRWLPRLDHSSFWEFTASGTFEKRIAESQRNGQIEKIKGGVRVKWLGPDAKPDEEWGVRTKGHHLFITAGGATTEYVRVVD